MDLRRWIADEHDGLAARWQSAVEAHVPRERWRESPGGGASIGWLILHGAWHQDLAINGIVRDAPAIILGWRGPLGLDAVPAETGLGEAEQPAVTAMVDLDALVGYAATVHDATRRWLTEVDLATFDDVPDASSRMETHGITEASVPWLHALWRAKPTSWFVQWEAIGHVQGHLGEMIALRARLGLSPF